MLAFLEHVDAVFGALPKPVLIVDHSLCVVEANSAACKTLGISPQEIKGAPIERVIGLKGGRKRFQSLLSNVLDGGGEIDNLQLHCKLPPDSHRTFALSARCLALGDTNSGLALAELIDITDQKIPVPEAQDLNATNQQHGVKLQGSNEDLEFLSLSVSHDLRMPPSIHQ